MDLNDVVQRAAPVLIAVAWKVAGAIALWILGRVLISFALRMVEQTLRRQPHFDVTLARYAHTALSILLNVALVVAVLGFFGVETTTFAALIAANAHYWQVYFDTNRLIREAFTDAGFPSPAPGYVITEVSAA